MSKFEFGDDMKSTCIKCKSTDITATIAYDFADIEVPIRCSEGEIIGYDMVSVNGEKLTCDQCGNYEIFC